MLWCLSPASLRCYNLSDIQPLHIYLVLAVSEMTVFVAIVCSNVYSLVSRLYSNNSFKYLVNRVYFFQINSCCIDRVNLIGCASVVTMVLIIIKGRMLGLEHETNQAMPRYEDQRNLRKVGV